MGDRVAALALGAIGLGLIGAGAAVHAAMRRIKRTLITRVARVNDASWVATLAESESKGRPVAVAFIATAAKSRNWEELMMREFDRISIGVDFRGMDFVIVDVSEVEDDEECAAP